MTLLDRFQDLPPSRKAVAAFEYLGRFIDESPKRYMLTPQDLIAALTLYDAMGGEPTEQRVRNSVQLDVRENELTVRLTLNSREWSFHVPLDKRDGGYTQYRSLPPMKEFR